MRQRPVWQSWQRQARCLREEAWMKVLLTGSNGQLGQALRLSLPKAIKGEPLELIATSRQGGDDRSRSWR